MVFVRDRLNREQNSVLKSVHEILIVWGFSISISVHILVSKAVVVVNLLYMYVAHKSVSRAGNNVGSALLLPGMNVRFVDHPSKMTGSVGFHLRNDQHLADVGESSGDVPTNDGRGKKPTSVGALYIWSYPQNIDFGFTREVLQTRRILYLAPNTTYSKQPYSVTAPGRADPARTRRGAERFDEPLRQLGLAKPTLHLRVLT